MVKHSPDSRGVANQSNWRTGLETRPCVFTWRFNQWRTVEYRQIGLKFLWQRLHRRFIGTAWIDLEIPANDELIEFRLLKTQRGQRANSGSPQAFHSPSLRRSCSYRLMILRWYPFHRHQHKRSLMQKRSLPCRRVKVAPDQVLRQKACRHSRRPPLAMQCLTRSEAEWWSEPVCSSRSPMEIRMNQGFRVNHQYLQTASFQRRFRWGSVEVVGHETSFLLIPTGVGQSSPKSIACFPRRPTNALHQQRSIVDFLR